MKCPKCGYLGFENRERCRHCGYDFSLGPLTASASDIALDRGVEERGAPLDLDRIIGAPESAGPADLPLFSPSRGEVPHRRVSARGAEAADDLPMISAPTRPRAPLGVRRATPEVPRARPRALRPSGALEDNLFAAPPAAAPTIERVFEQPSEGGATLAAPSSRIMAALVDVSLLLALDAVVLYLTLRLCGLTTAEIVHLPALPLAAFLLLLNGGYFVAFTAVGGQSIGKMALGIKVIAQEDGAVPVGRATIRTLAYLVSALPLGAGFLPGVMSTHRLALHDRLAHTRVVRPS